MLLAHGLYLLGAHFLLLVKCLFPRMSCALDRGASRNLAPNQGLQ